MCSTEEHTENRHAPASYDFTARQRTEDELYALVDTMPQLVWIGRSDGYIEYHNQRWRDYTRLAIEHTRGNEWTRSLHPADRQMVLATWQNAVQTGTPYEIEQRVRDGATGTYRWFLARGAPYKDVHDRVIKWIGTLTDIDDKKRAEQTLKASEEQLRVLAEVVPQFVWATRPDGYMEYWNQRYINYVQVAPEEFRGYGWRQFLHPDDYARVLQIRQHSLTTGTPYEVEYRVREGRTGTYRWFLARGMPARDASGQIIKWFGTCTDIEDQKRLEETLRESQERAQALMESTIMGVVVAEGETLVEANNAFLEMTGYSREEVQNGLLSFSAITPPEYASRDQQALKELVQSRQIKPYETAYICKDGSRLPILVGVVTLPRHPSRTIGFVLDNSARTELERRKDDFISMASHELRTPLTSLKLQTQLLARQLAKQDNPRLVAALARMEGQVTRLERLVGEMLDVSKIQAGKLEFLQETVNLDELLGEVVETIQQMCTTHTLVMHGAVRIPLIGDRDRLSQVFTNLITNAIKYSPTANRVDIEVSSCSAHIIVRVRDQGIGIPQEQRAKIFERFHRAVERGQKAFPGLGMGLYIVSEIVKQHGGTITVDSKINQGSTFTVALPLARTDDAPGLL